MLAGGAEAAIIPSGIGGFIACKALSKRNDDPEAASRPWDKGRDGFVMGEGAGGWRESSIWTISPCNTRNTVKARFMKVPWHVQQAKRQTGCGITATGCSVCVW